MPRLLRPIRLQPHMYSVARCTEACKPSHLLAPWLQAVNGLLVKGHVAHLEPE